MKLLNYPGNRIVISGLLHNFTKAVNMTTGKHILLVNNDDAGTGSWNTVFSAAFLLHYHLLHTLRVLSTSSIN